MPDSSTTNRTPIILVIRKGAKRKASQELKAKNKCESLVILNLVYNAPILKYEIQPGPALLFLITVSVPYCYYNCSTPVCQVLRMI